MDAEALSLVNLKRGAAVELVDDEIRRVLENIIDPNTEPTASRTVTLKLTLKPDKARETAAVDIAVTSRLAPPTGATASLFILNTRNGVVGVENDPRQRELFEEPENVVDMKKGGAS